MSAAANDNFSMPKPKPIHEVRLGAIKAAVWKNDTSQQGDAIFFEVGAGE